MGYRIATLAAHDAWALWLAAPVLGIAMVCLGVWWWSRPARPVTTARSIDGHHAYLDALSRSPRERVVAPAADLPPVLVDQHAHAVVLDAVDDDDTDARPSTVTLHG
ncbi:hypothetical protein ACXR2U_06975 [Jatrophihabitans sp. YIM 134969]